MKRAGRLKLNHILTFAFVLCCLVFAFVHLTGAAYGRYAAGSIFEKRGRVMAFGQLKIEEVSYDSLNPAVMVPGKDIKKDVTVSFEGSEWSVYVFMKVILSDHWEKLSDSCFGIEQGLVLWHVASDWTLVDDGKDDDQEVVYVIELESETALNQKEFIRNGVIEVSELLGKVCADQMAKDVSMSFQAYAIQSNGFTSPDEAWASIRSEEV